MRVFLHICVKKKKRKKKKKKKKRKKKKDVLPWSPILLLERERGAK